MSDDALNGEFSTGLVFIFFPYETLLSVLEVFLGYLVPLDNALFRNLCENSLKHCMVRALVVFQRLLVVIRIVNFVFDICLVEAIFVQIVFHNHTG